MKKSFAIIFIVIGILGYLLTGCAKQTDTTPDSVTRSSYLGRWSVTESWTKLTYEVNITADPGSSDGVFISNFANTGSSATPAGAVVKGSSIILDANQVISGITINGSGSLSGTTINWNYTLNNGADLINAVAIYSKI
ncbi:MAG: hypothetical protein WCP32_00835 [Bacteroidota bacterium]